MKSNRKGLGNNPKFPPPFHLSIHNGSERKVVEEVSKILPDIGVTIFPQTLIIEAIYLSDLSAFMVTSKNCDSVGETNLHVCMCVCACVCLCMRM